MGYYTQLFAAYGIEVGQVLLTVDDVTRHSHYRNAYRTFGRLLELGVLPIVNENDTVATHEIRFGDNDRLAALVAHLVHADALVLLSDVDALYTAKPSLPDAVKITDVRGEDDLAGIDVESRGSAVGTGGMITKIEAARIATSAGIPAVLARADQVAAALAGEPVGTLFHPTGRRRSTRLLWLKHASDARGELILDAGAVRALTQRNASLLPAGITRVQGLFSAGRAGEPARPRRGGRRPRAGQLRLRRAARAARPDHPRPDRGVRGRLRPRGGASRRARGALAQGLPARGCQGLRHQTPTRAHTSR